MTHMRKQLELLPCFLEQITSYVFEQVCTLVDAVLPEVVE